MPGIKLICTVLWVHKILHDHLNIEFLLNTFHFRSEISKVLAMLGTALHKAGLLFVLVIPPPVYHGDNPGMFDATDYSRLSPVVDYFSLMTYDYSSPARPGPNSPLGWVRR